VRPSIRATLILALRCAAFGHLAAAASLAPSTMLSSKLIKNSVVAFLLPVMHRFGAVAGGQVTLDVD
jgi:hypothetical protein